MTTIATLHKKWVKEPAYRHAHKEQEAEFDLARALIQAVECRAYAATTG